tara:strand:- start:455 stop:649 length:195 start_codon:yes stop_codon:yes gene_type:complete
MYFSVIFKASTTKVQENFNNVQELNEAMPKYESRGFCTAFVTATEGSRTKNVIYSFNGLTWEKR